MLKLYIVIISDNFPPIWCHNLKDAVSVAQKYTTNKIVLSTKSYSVTNRCGDFLYHGLVWPIEQHPTARIIEVTVAYSQ